MTELIARINAKGYKIWLSQREDKLWQCTLHVFEESPMFFYFHIGELLESLLQAERGMDLKISREGRPKKPPPRAALDIGSVLAEIGL